MKTKMSLLIGLVFTGYSAANAQKLVTESGNTDFLKGEKSFLIEYTFDGLTVGKNKPEEVYTKEKVAEQNAKEPGKGDKWLEGWKKNRETRYQPKFEELLDKMISGKATIAPASSGAKYKLIVNTTMIEPGYNIGVSKMPAYINVTFSWVEAAAPDKVLCKQTLYKVAGSQFSGYDYDVGSRVAESYAKSGKILGKYLASKVWK